MAEPTYAEGTRRATECKHCHSPIWIVYHGPQANHTKEPRRDFPDDRAQVDELVRAARELATWAEEARGHYGIEECAGPMQASTEWDDIQEGLQDAAARVRAQLAPFPDPEPEGGQ